MTGDTRPLGTVERALRAEDLGDYVRFENGQLVRKDRAHEARPVRALTNGRPILRFPPASLESGRQRSKRVKAERRQAKSQAAIVRDAREFNPRLELRRQARTEKHEIREVA